MNDDLYEILSDPSDYETNSSAYELNVQRTYNHMNNKEDNTMKTNNARYLNIKPMKWADNRLANGLGIRKADYLVTSDMRIVKNVAATQTAEQFQKDRQYRLNNYGGKVFHGFTKSYNKDVIDPVTDPRVTMTDNGHTVYISKIVFDLAHGSGFKMPYGDIWRYTGAFKMTRYYMTAEMPKSYRKAKMYYTYGIQGAHEKVKEACYNANRVGSSTFNDIALALATELKKYNVTVITGSPTLPAQAEDNLKLQETWDMYITKGAREELNARGISDELIMTLVGPDYFDLGADVPMMETSKRYVPNTDGKFIIHTDLTLDHSTHYQKSFVGEPEYAGNLLEDGSAPERTNSTFKTRLRNGYGNRYLEGQSLVDQVSDYSSKEIERAATLLKYYLDLSTEDQCFFFNTLERMENDWDADRDAEDMTYEDFAVKYGYDLADEKYDNF